MSITIAAMAIWNIVQFDLRQKILTLITIRETAEVPYTRIIEHKHFEFGTQPTTIISKEYSSEWQPGVEPYYPVNNDKNNAVYEDYAKLASSESGVIFGGRLGQYKYYDMDKVVIAALDCVKEEF